MNIYTHVVFRKPVRGFKTQLKGSLVTEPAPKSGMGGQHTLSGLIGWLLATEQGQPDNEITADVCVELYSLQNISPCMKVFILVWSSYYLTLWEPGDRAEAQKSSALSKGMELVAELRSLLPTWPLSKKSEMKTVFTVYEFSVECQDAA